MHERTLVLCHSLILGLAIRVAGASSRSNLEQDAPATESRILILSCDKALVLIIHGVRVCLCKPFDEEVLRLSCL